MANIHYVRGERILSGSNNAVPGVFSVKSIIIGGSPQRGTEAQLLVDTGASYVTIEPELVDALSLPLAERQPVSIGVVGSSTPEVPTLHVADYLVIEDEERYPITASNIIAARMGVTQRYWRVRWS